MQPVGAPHQNVDPNTSLGISGDFDVQATVNSIESWKQLKKFLGQYKNYGARSMILAKVLNKVVVSGSNESPSKTMLTDVDGARATVAFLLAEAKEEIKQLTAGIEMVEEHERKKREQQIAEINSHAAALRSYIQSKMGIQGELLELPQAEKRSENAQVLTGTPMQDDGIRFQEFSGVAAIVVAPDQKDATAAFCTSVNGVDSESVPHVLRGATTQIVQNNLGARDTIYEDAQRSGSVAVTGSTMIYCQKMQNGAVNLFVSHMGNTNVYICYTDPKTKVRSQRIVNNPDEKRLSNDTTSPFSSPIISHIVIPSSYQDVAIGVLTADAAAVGALQTISLSDPSTVRQGIAAGQAHIRINVDKIRPGSAILAGLFDAKQLQGAELTSDGRSLAGTMANTCAKHLPEYFQSEAKKRIQYPQPADKLIDLALPPFLIDSRREQRAQFLKNLTTRDEQTMRALIQNTNLHDLFPEKGSFSLLYQTARFKKARDDIASRWRKEEERLDAEKSRRFVPRRVGKSTLSEQSSVQQAGEERQLSFQSGETPKILGLEPRDFLRAQTVVSRFDRRVKEGEAVPTTEEELIIVARTMSDEGFLALIARPELELSSVLKDRAGYLGVRERLLTIMDDRVQARQIIQSFDEKWEKEKASPMAVQLIESMRALDENDRIGFMKRTNLRQLNLSDKTVISDMLRVSSVDPSYAAFEYFNEKWGREKRVPVTKVLPMLCEKELRGEFATAPDSQDAKDYSAMLKETGLNSGPSKYLSVRGLSREQEALLREHELDKDLVDPNKTTLLVAGRHLRRGDVALLSRHGFTDFTRADFSGTDFTKQEGVDFGGLTLKGIKLTRMAWLEKDALFPMRLTATLTVKQALIIAEQNKSNSEILKGVTIKYPRGWESLRSDEAELLAGCGVRSFAGVKFIFVDDKAFEKLPLKEMNFSDATLTSSQALIVAKQSKHSLEKVVVDCSGKSLTQDDLQLLCSRGVSSFIGADFSGLNVSQMHVNFKGVTLRRATLTLDQAFSAIGQNPERYDLLVGAKIILPAGTIKDGKIVHSANLPHKTINKLRDYAYDLGAGQAKYLDLTFTSPEPKRGVKRIASGIFGMMASGLAIVAGIFFPPLLPVGVLGFVASATLAVAGVAARVTSSKVAPQMLSEVSAALPSPRGNLSDSLVKIKMTANPLTNRLPVMVPKPDGVVVAVQEGESRIVPLAPAPHSQDGSVFPSASPSPSDHSSGGGLSVDPSPSNTPPPAGRVEALEKAQRLGMLPGQQQSDVKQERLLPQDHEIPVLVGGDAPRFGA